ncbi:MAG: permease [Candidatus Gracilibacteria bacterium]|nr:permease [Candidatus Gracilibacteria bacterium]
MDIFYPIQFLADQFTFNIFGLTKGSYFTNALNFFIYDTVKIGLLLVLINFIMAIVNFYFPMEKARDILTKKRWFGLNYLIAALLGIVTPFCSCSSIPLFIGFTGAGIPLGITFTFLISSPLINESSLYLFPALFGLKVTILYNLFGIIIAVLGGMLIQKLKMEKYILPELLRFKSKTRLEMANEKIPFKNLLKIFWNNGFSITKKIFPYLTIGVSLGAIIHGFVPQETVEQILSSKSIFTVPLAVILGIPLYANSISVLPIIEALAQKGAPLGTILAFMTAIVTLSLPEAIILKKVMRWQLLAVFFGISTLGIILMGYAFNAIL